eukprot:Skav216627  [mRNA]  locus=scaffold3008:443582:458817:- [translate_table: standard]
MPTQPSPSEFRWRSQARPPAVASCRCDDGQTPRAHGSRAERWPLAPVIAEMRLWWWLLLEVVWTQENETEPKQQPVGSDLIRIWQSDDVYEKADDISIVNGFLVPDTETEESGQNSEWTYEVVQTFFAVSGGGWSRRPGAINTLWRLQNVQEDHLCTFPLSGATFSIGSDKTTGINPGMYSERNAFDGNVSTFWIAKCDPIPGSLAPNIWGDGNRFDGCEPEQAYIGVEFQEATTVRCVRLFQNVPRDAFEREQRPSWTAGFALQRWTGVEWKMEEQFWDSKAARSVPYGAYIPTLDTPFIGNAPGVWEDTRPPNASCWRLSNDDYTQGAVGAQGCGQWAVLELEFYTTDFCQEEPSGPKSTRIHNVYDKDIRETLTWESSCQFGRGGSGCIPGEAWLGLYTRGLQPDIKCFKIFQPRGRNGGKYCFSD